MTSQLFGPASNPMFNPAPVRGRQKVTLPAPGALVPGGTTGQKLVKLSNADYDVGWIEDCCPDETVFCDDFDRPDGPVGSSWSGGTIVSGQFDLGGGSGPSQLLTAPLPSVDHWAEGTVTNWNPANNDGGSILLGISGGSYYLLGKFDDAWRIERYNFGVQTILSTGTGAPLSGVGNAYSIRAEVYTDSNGDVVLTIYERISGEWVARNTYTDTSPSKLIAGSRVGLQSWTSSFSEPRWDNFCSGTIGAPPEVFVPVLDHFDDNDTSPWIVYTEGTGSVTETVDYSGVVYNGNDGTFIRMLANSRVELTYPTPVVGSDYVFEYMGGPYSSNSGTVFGVMAAYIWFRGTSKTNCLRLATLDDIDEFGGGSFDDRLVFQRVQGGVVTHSVTVHASSHHDGSFGNPTQPTQPSINDERMRVVCSGGSCQVQQWSWGSEVWVDQGTPIPDDGSMGGYFGMVVAGNPDTGQDGHVDLDYIRIYDDPNDDPMP